MLYSEKAVEAQIRQEAGGKMCRYEDMNGEDI